MTLVLIAAIVYSVVFQVELHVCSYAVRKGFFDAGVLLLEQFFVFSFDWLYSVVYIIFRSVREPAAQLAAHPPISFEVMFGVAFAVYGDKAVCVKYRTLQYRSVERYAVLGDVYGRANPNRIINNKFISSNFEDIIFLDVKPEKKWYEFLFLCFLHF